MFLVEIRFLNFDMYWTCNTTTQIILIHSIDTMLIFDGECSSLQNECSLLAEHLEHQWPPHALSAVACV